MRRGRGVVVLVLAAVLAGGGCRRAGERSGVVEFWAFGQEGEAVQRMVPAFEASHPGLRVRVQQIPWSAAHEKLLTAFVGDAMPDVIQAGNTWIPELVTLGALAPLDASIAQTGLATDDLFPGILATNVVDGATWGVPWYVDTRVLFYRSDLLRAAGYPEPPVTWDGWVDAMARLEAAAPDRYAILLPLTEWQMPVILALQRGATLLRDDGQYGAFGSPAFRAAFTFYVDLFRRGFAPRAGAAAVANLYQDFAAGWFAIYPSGPWNLGEFARRMPAALADAWATAPMPALEGPGPGVSLAGGASLAVVRGARDPAAAWRWVAWLAEPEQQRTFFHLTGDLPARRAAWDDPVLRDDARAQVFWRQLAHVAATPQIPEWERIATEIGAAAEAAIRSGGTDLDGALAALDADVDGILAKRRWMLAQARGTHALEAAPGAPAAPAAAAGAP